MFNVPEQYRWINAPGAYKSTAAQGNNGVFLVPLGRSGKKALQAKCIVGDGLGWEHVSVSLNRSRCPTWDEMCQIKALFWESTDCVMQLHPVEAQYVNTHSYVLHLWRPTDQEIPTPPMSMV